MNSTSNVSPAADAPEIDALDARVGAEDVDAEPVADQHADHRIVEVALARARAREW